ncbi:unnamed protein product [Clonostachys byssicola]|uniref:Reverse transcriptase domain-containing protein n=1 Tax=Clonostachys byssicola TaxID=160290 RepID=A0A9N9UWZ3_9HYPO|nr:unnamed protein product [Clonostachys byssicola]
MESSSDAPAWLERIPHHSLRIASVNLKRSRHRLEALLRYMNEQDESWDVVAIQDLPIEFAFTPSPGYDLFYWSNRELEENDKPPPPWDSQKKPDTTQVQEPKPARISSVGFYIAQYISSLNWAVTRPPPDDANTELVATLHLTTQDAILDIHNIYNRDNKLDLDELFIYAAGSEHVIFVGDFNIEHPESNKKSQKSKSLGQMMKGAKMTCLTPSDKITYSRSHPRDDGLYSSTIDLIFVSKPLLDRAPGREGACRVLNVRGFETDHRVTETTISIKPVEAVGVQYLWKQVNHDKFREAMRKAFEILGFPPLGFRTEVDAYTAAVLNAMGSVIESQARIRRQNSRRQHQAPRSPELEELMEKEAQLFREYDQNGSQQTLTAWETQRMSTQQYRQTMTDNAAKTKNTVHKDFRQSAQRSQPRKPPIIPTLEVDGRRITKPKEQADCLVNSIWPDVHPIKKGQHRTRRGIPKPVRLSPSLELQCFQRLRDGELRDIIKGLNTGRSSLPDGIGNEAMIICIEECLPYLEHLFNACLALKYHPVRFKHAITIMLRKPSKSSYTSPKSWRPVALLSCVGKVLEKIIANKIRDLAIEHNLVPKYQYAAPGRSTTHALQFLVNIVYRGWSFPQISSLPRFVRRRLVSLLGFDITGAYDRIPWERLLEALLRKRMPYWIVEFCWSFLSGRTTNLRFPGHESECYEINVGIPQGSPLSPILFLLFIAGLLESNEGLANPFGPGVEFYIFGYADDHYIVAISPDYETNCDVFRVVTDVIMGWARENDVIFNPAKYIVMHFRGRRIRDDRAFERILWAEDEKDRKAYGSDLKKDTSRMLLSPVSQALPAIEGVTLEALVTQTRILGVIVDDELNWGPHINTLKTKVYAKVGYMKRISGPTWGKTLWQMRQLYLTSIRPIISYGCGAWFSPPGENRIKWRLTKHRMAQLETLQYRCLLAVSGAMNGTSRETLLTELGIPSLEVYLGQQAKMYRTRMLDTPEYKELERIRMRFPLGKVKAAYNRHPFHLLFCEANALRGLAEENELTKLKAEFIKSQAKSTRSKAKPEVFSPSQKQLRQAIKRFISKNADARSRTEWKAYIDAHKNGLRTYMDGWVDHPGFQLVNPKWHHNNFKLYKDLRRAESTMLLHCRTGCIQLRHYLHSKRDITNHDVPNSQCPCGTGKHTALHLFLECPNLHDARQRLTADLGQHDLSETLGILLGKPKEAGILARWAIQNFGIEQFKCVPPPNKKGNTNYKRKHHNAHHNAHHKEEHRRKKLKTYPQ